MSLDFGPVAGVGDEQRYFTLPFRSWH
jgi:hypothetical protein